MRSVAWLSSVKYTSMSFGLMQQSRGGPDGARQQRFTVGTGARWVGSLTTPPLSLSDGQKLRAWLHSLRGASGTFVFPVPTDATTTTTGVYVVGPNYLLAMTGVANPALVAPGKYLKVTLPSGAVQLCQIGYIASGGGASPTVQISPRLREIPTAGATVTIGAISVEMRLANTTPKVPLRLDRALSVQLDFEEAY